MRGRPRLWRSEGAAFRLLGGTTAPDAVGPGCRHVRPDVPFRKDPGRIGSHWNQTAHARLRGERRAVREEKFGRRGVLPTD